MFKPGSIRKIVVENFVTYSYAELYPGPNLNMLIGPNGTGKSTVVAAIILGLGGNPKTVGRGTKVTDYIKHDCTTAKISIFLQGNSENDVMKVSREFHADDKNYWKLNDNQTNGKEILKFVAQYNIQVDNLCQFLPQDRVQDFAKMNKQELLKQTQVAICRHDLIEQQENLISQRDKHNTLRATLQKYNQQLKEAIESNNRVEAKVKNFRKKKQYITQVQSINRKIAWVSHEKFKTRLDKVREDRQQASKRFEKHKKGIKPLENAVNNARRTIDQIQMRVSNHSRCVRETYNKVNEKLENHRNFNETIQQIKNEKNARLKEIEKSVAEVRNVTMKIESIVFEKQALMQQCENEVDMDRRLAEQNIENRKLMAQKRIFGDQIEDINNRRHKLVADIRALGNELNRLQNVKQQRLQHLQRIDNDVYKAVMWLRENKNLFQGEVYEPMLLEINVLNPNHALYIENIIAIRDRIAFTCVQKDDMNLLIRHLREQQGLSINVIHSGPHMKSSASYRPNVPLESVMHFGFFAYTNSLFTAPEPIMKYLCKFYNIHCIPVGNEKVNSSFANVPPEITTFFSNNTRYAISHSKYTGAKNARQNEIYSDGSLSVSVDAVRIETINGQLQELNRTTHQYDSQIDGIKQQITQIEQTMAKISRSMQEKQEAKRSLRDCEKKLEILRNNVQQMEQNIASRDEIDAEMRSRVKEVVQLMIESQREVKAMYHKYLKHIIDHEKENLNLSVTQKELRVLTESYEKLFELKNKSEQALQELNRQYNILESEGKVVLQRAKDLSKGFHPNDKGFDEFRADFERLTDNLEELENEKDQINARLDCLTTANEREMEEYEQKTALIEELKVSLERGNMELENCQTSRNSMRDEWLAALNEVVGEINQRFGAAFERMGCVGEVGVCKGEDEDDFAQYGLSIKVTYRDGEPLQELNTTVQSGGERAVATAAFMLSLQELTPVPFRCVDEINQGMDANNERRIFELLVDSTSQANTSQYFLITPKLVSNLKFVQNMKVHIVHNGPFLASVDKWKNTTLCNTEMLEIY